MKNFYIENFALRLVFCIVGMFALWNLGSFVGATFIRHEPFVFSPSNFIIPIATGAIEAFAWKPKE